MARIRTIKPEFATSRQVVECSPTARLLFVEMWCFCDDYGVHPADHLRLKMECFPGDPFTIEHMEGWVEELLRSGLLEVFSNANTLYWHVTGWDRHQRVEKPNRKFPRPFDDGSVTIPQPFDDSSEIAHPRKGREGKGREGITTKQPMPPAGAVISSGLESDSNGTDPHGEETEVSTPPAHPKYTPEFERLWGSYPRTNGSKASAFKAWKKLKLPKHELHVDEMLDAVRLQVEHKAALERRGEWCAPFPFLEKWLKEERWTVKPEELKGGAPRASERIDYISGHPNVVVGAEEDDIPI